MGCRSLQLKFMSAQLYSVKMTLAGITAVLQDPVTEYFKHLNRQYTQDYIIRETH